ncbi:MAG: D-glycero-beta-D-manno-heptose 1-phosphate adenylyltransferase [Flavobacteriales bacterium]|nr:D-glycero-beta-D-manno-heptose 1-phosphate adenylyltransferase [Flavobacteriales bacterium]
MSAHQSLSELVSSWKKQGLRVVFTNGVFDILHAGHVDYLEKAASLGDRLIVGLNSDASVRRLGKAPDRPLNEEGARKKVLGALRCVDAVEVFAEDTPLALITLVKPDVLVKGGDYDPAETRPDHPAYMVGSDVVRAAGGQVVAIPLLEGFSTTGLVNRIKKS